MGSYFCSIYFYTSITLFITSHISSIDIWKGKLPNLILFRLQKVHWLFWDFTPPNLKIFYLVTKIWCPLHFNSILISNPHLSLKFSSLLNHYSKQSSILVYHFLIGVHFLIDSLRRIHENIISLHSCIYKLILSLSL